MKTVRHVLDEKGREIWSIRPADSVYSAIELMANKAVGALLVMEGDSLEGIVSERDYARKVILQGRSSRETTVEEIMTPRVICIGPESSVEDAMALMTEKRVRHLPVVVEGRVDGVISIGDVVRGVISEREFQIELLEKYIQGG
jgi:CBS domain-containing protein